MSFIVIRAKQIFLFYHKKIIHKIVGSFNFLGHLICCSHLNNLLKKTYSIRNPISYYLDNGYTFIRQSSRTLKKANYIVDTETLVVFLIGQVLFSLSGFISLIYWNKQPKIFSPEKVFVPTTNTKNLLLFLVIMLPFYLKEIITIAQSSEMADLNLYLALRHRYVNNGVTLGDSGLFTYYRYLILHYFSIRLISQKIF